MNADKVGGNREERRAATVLKGAEAPVKVSLDEMIAHLLLVLPEFLERLTDAVEAMADCAELEAEYAKRSGLREGVFIAEDFDKDGALIMKEGDDGTGNKAA